MFFVVIVFCIEFFLGCYGDVEVLESFFEKRKGCFFLVFIGQFFKFKDVAVSLCIINGDSDIIPNEGVAGAVPFDVDVIAECLE